MSRSEPPFREADGVSLGSRAVPCQEPTGPAQPQASRCAVCNEAAIIREADRYRCPACGVDWPVDDDRVSCGGVHEVSAEQFDALLAAIQAREDARADEMPTVQDAIKVMHRAYIRLKELGWNDAIYCPKDGTPFEIIEVGSTGIFRCHYEGEWPKGSWWAEDGGDLWPSRPTLYRALADGRSGDRASDAPEPSTGRRANPNSPTPRQMVEG